MLLWIFGAALGDEPCPYIGIAPTDLSPPGGCVTTTPRHVRSWKRYKIRSNIHPARHPAIRGAFDTWRGNGSGTPNPSTNVDFRYAGTTSFVNFGDKKYTVSSVSATWMQQNGLVGNEFAHTFRAFRGPNHSTEPCALKGADIIINSSYWDTFDDLSTLVTNPVPIAVTAACDSQSAVWPRCAVGLETVVAHEVGHVLGIGHAFDTLQLMSLGYPFSGDAGLGVTGAMGEDYECIRDAQENIDAHPAFEWVYRGYTGTDQLKNFSLRRYRNVPIGVPGTPISFSAATEVWADVFDDRQRPFLSQSVVRGVGYAGPAFGLITASYRGAQWGTGTVTWALLYPNDGSCEDAIAMDQGVPSGSRRRVMLTQTRSFSYNGEDVEMPTTGFFIIPANAPTGVARVCAQIVSVSASIDNDLSDNVIVSEDTVDVQ